MQQKMLERKHIWKLRWNWDEVSTDENWNDLDGIDLLVLKNV